MSVLKNQTAEEFLADGMSALFFRYIQMKDAEVEKCKGELELANKKIQFLSDYIAQSGMTVPDFSKGIPPSIKRPQKKEINFDHLIQIKNKKRVLQVLHKRIDGRGGKEVALILLKAKEVGWIFKVPNEKEFRSEFTNFTGTWRSISFYFNPNVHAGVDTSSITLGL